MRNLLYFVGIVLMASLLFFFESEPPARAEGSQSTPIPVDRVPESADMATSVPAAAPSAEHCLKCAISTVVFITRFTGGQSMSYGSGVILREDGLIATNYHVIEGGETITVTLRDGRSFPADRVAMANAGIDIALIKISAKDLPSVAIRERPLPEATDKVYAIGSPKGLTWSVTDGIVSRILPGQDKSFSVIQHTATVAPGSSGGALVDESGALVGLNTLMDNRVAGLNYAVDLAEVLHAMPAIGVEIPTKSLQEAAPKHGPEPAWSLRMTIRQQSFDH